MFGGVGVAGSLAVGIGGLIKNRADAKVGLRSDTRERMTMFEARYQAILEEMRTSLIDPLRLEVDRLRDDVEALGEQLAAERAAGKVTARQYRQAPSHIRALRAWIALQSLVIDQPPPDPPEVIVEDLR